MVVNHCFYYLFIYLFIEFNKDINCSIQFEVVKEEILDDVDEVPNDDELQLNEQQQQETIDMSTASITSQEIDSNDLEKVNNNIC